MVLEVTLGCFATCLAFLMASGEVVQTLQMPSCCKNQDLGLEERPEVIEIP